MKDIGAKIRTERQNKKVSQRELAEILGVKQNTISQYENNRKQPSYDVLILLADFFGVTTDFLLGRED